MSDLRTVLKDMMRQRTIQAGTALLAVAGMIGWLMGVELGAYIAALAIIICAVATIKWIDDEEKLEVEKTKKV